MNVAVSRARYEMIVFSTLKSSQIDLKRSNAKGVEGLKGFLEFAETGRLPMVSGNSNETDKNVMISQICEMLSEQGYTAQPCVGRSNFKVDIAVSKKEDPEKYNDEMAYGMYNADGFVNWSYFDDTQMKYVYKFEKAEDGNWNIINFVDDTYIEKGTANYGQKVSTSATATMTQEFTLIKEGKFAMTWTEDRSGKYIYTLTASHNGSKNGDAEPGTISVWGSASEAAKFGVNVWYIVPITDEMREQIENISDNPADVNGDGKLNTADVVAVYTYIQLGESSGFLRDAADVNGDGNVNTADVVAIYTAIIGNVGSKPYAKSGAYPGAETIDGSDNVLTILVESTDDLSKIPVTLYLTNPTNGITAVEATLVAPVDVNKFLFDADEDDFVYDPAPMLSAGTEEHGADGFFISIADSKTRDFKETEGAIITVYFDGSELGDGDYTVKMKDAISVAVGDITYTSADVDAAFSVKDGKVTAVNSVIANAAAAGKTVYGVDGKKATSTQKGQIYVIDGKTVRF